MSARIHNIGIDCHDTYALAGFWAQVFECPRQPDDFPGDPEAMLLPPAVRRCCSWRYPRARR